jgi:uncharacterized protein YjiS (DUF1127 family)
LRASVIPPYWRASNDRQAADRNGGRQIISTRASNNAAATLRRTAAITPSVTVLARAALTAILSWDDRRRQRHALAELDEHLLRDIGLTRNQARMEARRLLQRR